MFKRFLLFFFVGFFCIQNIKSAGQTDMDIKSQLLSFVNKNSSNAKLAFCIATLSLLPIFRPIKCFKHFCGAFGLIFGLEHINNYCNTNNIKFIEEYPVTHPITKHGVQNIRYWIDSYNTKLRDFNESFVNLVEKEKK